MSKAILDLEGPGWKLHWEADMLDLDEAAKYLRIGMVTMWRWQRSGKAKHRAFVDGRYFFLRSDLDMLKSKATKPKPLSNRIYG